MNSQTPNKTPNPNSNIITNIGPVTPTNKVLFFRSRNESRKSCFRIKSQITVDTSSYKSGQSDVNLPKILSARGLGSGFEQGGRGGELMYYRDGGGLGLPAMNDDFGDRKCVYREKFLMSRNPTINIGQTQSSRSMLKPKCKTRLIQLQVSFTIKFSYITLYDAKFDQHYKLRLLHETGKQILEKFQTHKLQFKDHIYLDQTKKFILVVKWGQFERKYCFGKMEPSKVRDLEYGDEDVFLKEQIKKLDRTQNVFGGQIEGKSKLTGIPCKQIHKCKEREGTNEEQQSLEEIF